MHARIWHFRFHTGFLFFVFLLVMRYTWTRFNVFTVHVLLFGNDALHYACKCEHMPVWISVLISLDSLKCFFKPMCGLYSSKLKNVLSLRIQRWDHKKLSSSVRELSAERRKATRFQSKSCQTHTRSSIFTPAMSRDRFILIRLVSGIYYIQLQKWSNIVIIIQSHHTLQVLTNYIDGVIFWALFYIFL